MMPSITTLSPTKICFSLITLFPVHVLMALLLNIKSAMRLDEIGELSG